VYHPWVQAREVVTPELAPLRTLPPSGAICGTIAARELARGCWIAPANLPLRGTVALAPVLPASTWPALFDARFNLIRQQPGQFSALSAHTLSDDRQLVQLSVRRLLIFLRKLALQRGMRYVFESNTESFRRRVQHGFERTLRSLAARGAVVAFRVIADDTLNTPNDIDHGRLVVAIQVAPTLPVEFITVVLIRSGEDVLSVVER
jgi:phage tail sheath protein FI